MSKMNKTRARRTFALAIETWHLDEARKRSITVFGVISWASRHQAERYLFDLLFYRCDGDKQCNKNSCRKHTINIENKYMMLKSQTCCGWIVWLILLCTSVGIARKILPVTDSAGSENHRLVACCWFIWVAWLFTRVMNWNQKQFVCY